KAKHETRSIELYKLTKRMEIVTAERGELASNQAMLKESADELSGEIERIEQILHSQSISAQTIEQMDGLKLQIDKLRQNISYRQIVQQIGETEQSLTSTHKDLEMKKSEMDDMQ